MYHWNVEKGKLKTVKQVESKQQERDRQTAEQRMTQERQRRDAAQRMRVTQESARTQLRNGLIEAIPRSLTNNYNIYIAHVRGGRYQPRDFVINFDRTTGRELTSGKDYVDKTLLKNYLNLIKSLARENGIEYVLDKYNDWLFGRFFETKKYIACQC